MLATLRSNGKYLVRARVLNTLNFGIPQNRPRVYIVGVLRTGYRWGKRSCGRARSAPRRLWQPFWSGGPPSGHLCAAPKRAPAWRQGRRARSLAETTPRPCWTSTAWRTIAPRGSTSPLLDAGALRGERLLDQQRGAGATWHADHQGAAPLAGLAGEPHRHREGCRCHGPAAPLGDRQCNVHECFGLCFAAHLKAIGHA